MGPGTPVGRQCRRASACTTPTICAWHPDPRGRCPPPSQLPPALRLESQPLPPRLQNAALEVVSTVDTDTRVQVFPPPADAALPAEPRLPCSREDAARPSPAPSTGVLWVHLLPPQLFLLKRQIGADTQKAQGYPRSQPSPPTSSRHREQESGVNTGYTREQPRLRPPSWGLNEPARPRGVWLAGSGQSLLGAWTSWSLIAKAVFSGFTQRDPAPTGPPHTPLVPFLSCDPAKPGGQRREGQASHGMERKPDPKDRQCLAWGRGASRRQRGADLNPGSLAAWPCRRWQAVPRQGCPVL